MATLSTRKAGWCRANTAGAASRAPNTTAASTGTSNQTAISTPRMAFSLFAEIHGPADNPDVPSNSMRCTTREFKVNYRLTIGRVMFADAANSRRSGELRYLRFAG